MRLRARSTPSGGPKSGGTNVTLTVSGMLEHASGTAQLIGCRFGAVAVPALVNPLPGSTLLCRSGDVGLGGDDLSTVAAEVTLNGQVCERARAGLFAEGYAHVCARAQNYHSSAATFNYYSPTELDFLAPDNLASGVSGTHVVLLAGPFFYNAPELQCRLGGVAQTTLFQQSRIVECHIATAAQPPAELPLELTLNGQQWSNARTFLFYGTVTELRRCVFRPQCAARARVLTPTATVPRSGRAVAPNTTNSGALSVTPEVRLTNPLDILGDPSKR